MAWQLACCHDLVRGLIKKRTGPVSLFLARHFYLSPIPPILLSLCSLFPIPSTKYAFISSSESLRFHGCYRMPAAVPDELCTACRHTSTTTPRRPSFLFNEAFSVYRHFFGLFYDSHQHLSRSHLIRFCSTTMWMC